MLYDIEPDWDETGTWEELEESIGSGFKYHGPGIYLSDTDTLLIFTQERGDGRELTIKNAWQSYQPSGTIFVAYCYNRPYHETPFAIIASTPVREDTRSK